MIFLIFLNSKHTLGLLPDIQKGRRDMNSNFNQETKANVKYKDSLFRKLFGENKTNALSLYNALNDSSYTNEEDLEFTTLEDVVYMKMRIKRMH